jgi:hypothetical protein
MAGLVCVGFLFANSASAAPKTGAKNPGLSSANAQLVQQLTGIRTTLNAADHDYDGHRAAAVHQISHAIHLLHNGKNHPNPSQTFVGGAHTEPQAASDAQLRKSMTALQGLTVPPGKHQAQVSAAITQAVADLQTALKIK